MQEYYSPLFLKHYNIGIILKVWEKVKKNVKTKSNDRNKFQMIVCEIDTKEEWKSLRYQS